MRGALRALASCLTGALLLAGCSGNDLHPVDQHRLEQWADAHGRDVSPWPLTSDDAAIDCLGGDALAIVVDGESYWLNGLGKGLADKFDLSDPEPIWLDDPNVDGLKVPMDELLDYALSVC